VTASGTGSLDWLDLQDQGSGRFALELTDALVRLDGQLYGGTGLAAVVGAMRAATGRDPLWATVQFVSTAMLSEAIELRVESLATGHRASQVRVEAFLDDRLLLSALGTAGAINPDGLHAEFGRMPQVSAPEDCPVWRHDLPFEHEGPLNGPFSTAEFRMARAEGSDPYMWVRMNDTRQTVESVAYLADFVPAAVVRAARRVGVGTSMDNSIRFGPPPDTDWILIETDPYFAHAGFVHGAGRVWSESGVLLAVASQTARAHLFD
jgi:acyl-CoA thioesterase